MKKMIFMVVMIITISLPLKSQYTTEDVFKVEDITFYGLDFSNIKLIGSEGFADPWDIQNRLFNSWNILFKSEADKFDIPGVFRKENVTLNLSLVRERNKIPDPEELVIDEAYSFGKEVVEKTISEYETEEEDGLGLVFVMESFNKEEKLGYMWVTFFDIKSKEVLFTEKMNGKAKGFGIRNYYAHTYFSVMKEIDKKKWKEWVKDH